MQFDSPIFFLGFLPVAIDINLSLHSPILECRNHHFESYLLHLGRAQVRTHRGCLGGIRLHRGKAYVLGSPK